ncbi:hypothetical protein BZM27_22855 [Paraburkholderia steynii]|uniref:Inositolphosphotransferase Aur1/Ipt1 domain-containing protein n=1 Tax=Paraburkholderia steynii TaxID=1245441 RepID=A0A4R0X9I7_9BURK|nr:hypothetical protein BZM27_22855 [Paraburkholderia steynii]
MIAAVIAIDVTGLQYTPHRIELAGGLRVLCGFLTVMLALSWITIRTRAGYDRSKWDNRLADLCFTTQWMTAFAAFCTAAGVLSYLSVAADFPLIDGKLVRFDEAVGFDWMAWYLWVRRHHALFTILSLAYSCGFVEAIVVPLILGTTGRRVEMIQHMARTMIATLIAVAVSAVLPAASAYQHFHVVDPGTASTVSHFFPLRERTLNVFDLTDLQGLISMPSMHTAMAILFVWALRRVPLLAFPAAVINAIMIVSTPSQGGHYLTDVATGALLAWMTIWLVNQLRFEDWYLRRF